MNFNSATSTSDVLVTTDGIGRQVFAQRRQAPAPPNCTQGAVGCTFDSIQTSYGWTPTTQSVAGGAIVQSSVPYSASAGQSAPAGTALATAQYDALGRPISVTDGGGGTTSYVYSQNDVLVTVTPAPSGEHAKSRQLEYDGLGRLTSVCEIVTSGGSSCGQSTAASGYKTSYAYTVPSGGGSQLAVTQGTQTRTYVYDALNRLTSETNPESGTTSYFWDAAPPACYNNVGWSTPGDLGAKRDNAGTYACYGYDALHRLQGGLTSPSGPCFGLVYDSATPPSGHGIAAQNAAGQVVEAYTNNDCNGTTNVVTDEWFSYDADGRMTDMWESTPHSGGYYHTTATFAANGAPTSFGSIPGYTTTTYGLDGEGRLSSAQQGTTKLVCDTSCSIFSTTYNPAGQVTTINIGGFGSNGSADSDTYVYDAATGRMTNFTFTVGSPGKSFAGSLHWNQNGTLQQLAILDGFHSGGTQTCNYLYDDLGRIGTPPGSSSYSVDCGSSFWRQTFTYDQYGNVTKTANPGISWQPGYNQATNQYLTPANCVTQGGSPCYDADGNLLRDGFSSYAWDTYGRMTSINSGNSLAACGASGTCLTYDALGHVVEENNSGTFSEILYSPIGKTANMSGSSTVNYSYIPLPGGATLYSFLPGGTARYFQHKDWLGSARVESGIVNRLEEYDRAFAPFGEVYDRFDLSNGVNFTGDTQDTSAILFDTPNRELHSNQGRWISPDPAGIASVEAANPQTWNRYAYASNNPLMFIDPSGLRATCTPHILYGYVDGKLSSVDVWWECSDDGSGGGDGGGGGGIDTRSPSLGSPPVTMTCQGSATFSDVSQSQMNYLLSKGGGALRPNIVPSTGTVAIGGAQTFGLNRAQMRQSGGYITVNPTDLSGAIAGLGGPVPPYTVADVGDVNIRNSPGTRYDIYAFPDGTANTFGKQQSGATTTVIPTLTGAHCPSGSQAVQTPVPSAPLPTPPQ